VTTDENEAFLGQIDAEAIAGKPNGHANGHFNGTSGFGHGEAVGSIIFERIAPHPINSIPPRPWAYGHFLLFGSASAIGAVDGGGKGAMAVGIALSFITGRRLQGEKVWRSGPVAVLTYEDDQIEWCRRIAAACIHYKLDYESIIERFYFIGRDDGERVRLAAPSFVGRGVVFRDGPAIIEALKEIEAALFIVDPLNHAHLLEDGNSNAMIAQVADEISHIAKASNTATLVLHHLRKGATGKLDDMMGAVALRATFRATHILTGMTKEDPPKLGIDPDEAWRFSRIAGSKENYSIPGDRAQWFKFESVELGNGDTGIYPQGDNVQVFTPHTQTTVIDDMPKSVIAAIFARIRKGPEPGELYHFIRQSKRWAGTMISELADITEDQAATAIKEWTKEDRQDGPVFIKGNYISRKHSKIKAGCIRLNEQQARNILERLYEAPSAEDMANAPAPAAEDKAETAPGEPSPQKLTTANVIKLPNVEQIALDELARVIAADGVPLSLDEAPGNTRGVPLDSWREAALRGGLSIVRDSKKAFERASVSLIGRRLVGAQNGLVWLMSQ